jgi:hypothetical protein
MTLGCQSAGPRKPVVTTEPGLAGTVDSDGTTVAADGTRQVAPARTVTWVDRHPLFSKPRDYWDTSGDNKIVKAAAATFVGVPVGMYGEVKQIIVGVPQEVRYQGDPPDARRTQRVMKWYQRVTDTSINSLRAIVMAGSP